MFETLIVFGVFSLFSDATALVFHLRHLADVVYLPEWMLESNEFTAKVQRWEIFTVQ